MGDSVEVEYKKGDMRPIDRIVYPAPIDEAQAGRIVEMYEMHVRMRRLGLMPASPDPVGCRICESRRWCAHYEGTEQ